MKTNTFLPFVLNRCSRFIGVPLFAGMLASLMMPGIALSQTVYPNPAAVDLLTAGNYRALSGSTLNIAVGCTVTGNVGGVAVTNNGTVTGTTDINNSAVTTAINDLTTVKGLLAARTPDATPAVELGGTTLGRGIYSSGTFGINGTLTLTGVASDIFIFQTTTTLITGTACIVTMGGTALASNVYWQVGSAAEIAGDFKGNILAQSYITVTNASATIDGRSLALTAVTLGGTSVLPVELTSFTAALNNNAVELNWNTATEVNNYGFEVQRSETQNYNWAKVGFVNGAGNSNSPKNYSFVDKPASYGSYAYRLKQLDNDGKHTYSDVIEVNAAGQIPNGFLLNQNYPNPFNPSTQIQFGVSKNTYATLTVFNVLGVKVSTLFNGNAIAGQIYNVTLSGDNLASGIYYYKLQTNEKNEVRKMILLR
ncbi:MAG: ice-binding family protein [Ignavibacteriaceae bacterium]|jgi:hypothetical protein